MALGPRLGTLLGTLRAAAEVASARRQARPNSVLPYDNATLGEDRRLNIRLSSKDRDAIHKRSLADGLPYQTLIASVLHEYAVRRLKET